MDWDWKDVAKVVAPLAPTLGGVLGGFIPFPGASIAGQALGNLIAKQFGVEPTPTAVGAAVLSANNEVAIAKLRAATDEARAMYPAWAQVETAMAHLEEVRTTQVNTTMRAELLATRTIDKWRAACGWVLASELLGIGTITMAALVLALFGDTQSIKTIGDAWPLLLGLVTVTAAVVGVAIVAPRDKTVPPPEPAPVSVKPAVKAPGK